MRILIVGGGGYLGSALVKHFAGRHQCICFGHGRTFGEMRALISGDVEYVEGDLTNADQVRQIVGRAEAVIHVAGSGGEADCLADPTRSLLTHVQGTHLLMHEARRQNVARSIFTSTIAVYGTYRARPMPLTEEMETRPDEFYGALKATAERELIDAGRFQILRLANVYGHGSGLPSLASGVAGKFVELITEAKPLCVFGAGAQLIDYVHIDDVCRAYERALLSAPESNFIFNVGGGEPISILDLAQSVATIAADETGQRPEITYAPAPPDKLWPDRWLSISKIERELGWRPAVRIEDGLREMIANRVRPKVEAQVT